MVGCVRRDTQCASHADRPVRCSARQTGGPASVGRSTRKTEFSEDSSPTLWEKRVVRCAVRQTGGLSPHSQSTRETELAKVRCPIRSESFRNEDELNTRAIEISVGRYSVRHGTGEISQCLVGKSTGRTENRRGIRLYLLVVLFYLVFYTRIPGVHGVSLGAHLVCARVSGLTERQRAMCRASPASIAAVGDGLRMAYQECRAQLAGSRWNCSGIGEGNVFGHVMPLATKEAAFTYAITAAGVTHALSAACARGDLPSCPCKQNRRRAGDPHWAGCAEAARGARLARRFLDAREVDGDARTLVNLHNNRVGRKLVKDLIRLECKCHGVSGSCAVKTCWRALPPFKVVANALKEKYLRAKMVQQHPLAETAPAHSHLVIRRSKPHLGIGRQPRKSELVFLQASPSYCEPEPSLGVLGTHGRQCNKTSRGEDGCESLCCGRGYNTVRSTVASQCRCQFHWCCHVTCDTCVTKVNTHLCK